MMRASWISRSSLLALIAIACSSEVPIGDLRRDDGTTSMAGSSGAAGSGGAAGTPASDAAIDRTTLAGNGGGAGASSTDAASEGPADVGAGGTSTDGAAGSPGAEGGPRDSGDAGELTACEAVLSRVNRASWIAFDSDRDDFHRNLYMVHPDGTELTQLTKGTSNEREPFFTFDGTKLSYTATAAGVPQVFIMNLATRTSVQLTHRAEGADQSTFSRDGNWVAFHSGFSVYVMKTDGTGERAVAAPVGPNAGNAYSWPAFSADGRELVIQNLDTTGLAAFKLDGGGNRTVGGSHWPAVSPSGIDLASSFECDGGTVDGIWTSPFALATIPCISLGRRITPKDGYVSERASWGTESVLAYRRADQSTRLGVIAMIVRGDGRPCLLTSGPEDSANPSWSQ